jgi:hypothetical protein
MRPRQGGTPVDEGVLPDLRPASTATYSEVVMTTLIIKKNDEPQPGGVVVIRRLPAMSR